MHSRAHVVRSGDHQSGARSPADDATRTRPRIQRALVVGSADDPYEREADRIADRVVRMLTTDTPATAVAGPAAAPEVARRAETGTEPAWIDIDDLDNGESTETETETDQEQEPVAAEATPDIQTSRIRRAAAASVVGPEGGPVPDAVGARIRSASGQPMEAGLRRSMEHAFGADFGDVRIHRSADADALNHDLSARAFTVGNDVFFGQGEYAPGSDAGKHLIAHELAHVVQQAPGRRARRTTLIRRDYVFHKIDSNAHLRDRDQWDTMKGPKISSGSKILVDDNNTKRQKDIHGHDVLDKHGQVIRWEGAVNVSPKLSLPIGANRAGYIRKSRIGARVESLTEALERQVGAAIASGESVNKKLLRGKLFDATRAKHLDEAAFLVEKHLRLRSLYEDPEDVPGAFDLVPQRLQRIRDGAQFLAQSIEHWSTWLHPNGAKLAFLDYTKSDLHDRGLGVVRAQFTKPLGGAAAFATQTVVDVMIKPEDKSLEEALLGSDPTSAANQINQIVGIDTDPTRALTTIKMHSDAVYGSIIEMVQGSSAEDFVQGAHANDPLTASFYETIVFAFLAGMDDLHRENVFWSDGGLPYLIDADNVLSQAQMTQTGPGANPQSGFTGTTDRDREARAVHTDIANDTNTSGSVILQAMQDPINAGPRTQILQALQTAMTGKKSRVVPIRTNKWAGQLNEYAVRAGRRTTLVDDSADQQFLVRDVSGFDPAFGPGLHGLVGAAIGGGNYDHATERALIKRDFDSGSIPFYEYDFTTGQVLHDGHRIWDGQPALVAAMQLLQAKFP